MTMPIQRSGDTQSEDESAQPATWAISSSVKRQLDDLSGLSAPDRLAWFDKNYSRGPVKRLKRRQIGHKKTSPLIQSGTGSGMLGTGRCESEHATSEWMPYSPRERGTSCPPETFLNEQQESILHHFPIKTGGDDAFAHIMDRYATRSGRELYNQVVSEDALNSMATRLGREIGHSPDLLCALATNPSLITE